MKEKINLGKVGIAKKSWVYPYKRYAYQYINCWNFPTKNSSIEHDFGIDIFFLTNEENDFEDIETRINGFTIEELTS